MKKAKSIKRGRTSVVIMPSKTRSLDESQFCAAEMRAREFLSSTQQQFMRQVKEANAAFVKSENRNPSAAVSGIMAGPSPRQSRRVPGLRLATSK